MKDRQRRNPTHARKAPRRLDEEWLRWLRLNVTRGCSKEELRSILLSNGFDGRAVQEAFDQVGTNPLPSQPPTSRVELGIPNATRFPSPEIELYTAEDFLNPAECAELTSLIVANLRRSTVSTPPTGEADKAFRTSRTCDLVGGQDAVLALDSKICQSLGVAPAFAEPSQGQCYEVGQEFKAHTDFFKEYELERFSTPTLGQRTWTFMIYLNEPQGGGETRFVEVDLTVKPKLGMAVLWNNLLPSGKPNYFTRHQGMPVTAGMKAIITKWFRMPVEKRAAAAHGS